MRAISSGEIHRHIGSTNMNEVSSRAHTVVRLQIESINKESETLSSQTRSLRRSTLNLIDLAGSENSRMTGSTGIREQEGRFINKSPLALSTIIQRLSEAKSQHLPFRDSKLTRILQEPLSGNAVVAIICTITPPVTFLRMTVNIIQNQKQGMPKSDVAFPCKCDLLSATLAPL